MVKRQVWLGLTSRGNRQGHKCSLGESIFQNNASWQLITAGQQLCPAVHEYIHTILHSRAGLDGMIIIGSGAPLLLPSLLPLPLPLCPLLVLERISVQLAVAENCHVEGRVVEGCHVEGRVVDGCHVEGPG